MKKIGGALLITLLQSAVSLIAQLSLARILAPDIFGQFATCSVLVTVLMALANLQCDKYIISGKGKTLEERFKASAYIEFLVAIVFFGVALLVFPLILNLLNKEELIYYSLILACSVVYTPFTRNKAVLDSQLNFFKARFPQLLAQTIAAIVAVFLALNESGLIALVAWRLCAYSLEIVILIIVHGLPKFKVATKDNSKDILHFVKPLYWSAVIFTIYASFDYYILAALISDRELGLYWLAFQLTNYLLILKTTFNNILLPYYSRTEDSHIKIALLNNHTKLLTLFYFSVSVLCMMSSEIAIEIILGEEWIDMIVIFNLFTIVVMFKAFTSSFLPYLITIDKRKAELQSTVFALLALAILLPALSIKMGLIGALCAVIISTLLSFIYLYFRYIHRKIDGNYLKTFIGMILGSAMIYGSSLLSTTPRLFILILILAVTFMLFISYLKKIKLTLSEISGSYQ